MASKAALTEEDLIGRLKVRYSEQSGNGVAWAFVPGVRSAAAFDARRTIDAYAMSMWPSRGLSLHAFEIKSSRSDWLREMRTPEKAEEFCERADYFWLVVGDAEIVKAGELPETWGLLVPYGKGLRVQREAPRLRDANGNVRDLELPPAFGRSFLAAVLRSACYMGTAQPADIIAAERRGREQEQRLHKTQTERLETQLADLQEKARAFREASGLDIQEIGWPRHTAADVGHAVRQVLDGEHDLASLELRARRLYDDAKSVVSQAAKLLPVEREAAA